MTHFYRVLGKRLIDIGSSLTLLLLALPALATVALAVRWRLGSPVFFRQLRPGLHGRPFRVLKFRTMTDARDAEGQLLPDCQRLPPLGRFLRTWSLDELPQLWNVLRGEMSLIGPRPLLMEYLPKYTPQQALRHEVRPGITGWAQIHGRQEIPFSKRLELDVWYVGHCSLKLDLRILAATALRVLRSDGVKPDQDITEVDDLGFSVSTPSPLTSRNNAA